MPQHSVGRARSWQSRTLVLLLAIALAAGSVQHSAQSGPGGGNDTPAEAARHELRRAVGSAAADALVRRLGGTESWQTGTITIPAADGPDEFGSHDEPRVFLYVAHRNGAGWTAALEGTSAFGGLAGQAANALAGTASAQVLASTVKTSPGGAAQLSLPWARGQSWRLTGGPHSFTGSASRPWSSLDFAGPTPGVSTKVRAARNGTVVRPCANLVQVRHADGWATSYYHVKNVAVRAGQSVARGALLGYTSKASGCGGYATGVHVHFSVLKSGSYVNVRGHTIGGWTVADGSSAYKGCLVKRTVTRCAPKGLIYNDGAIGSK
jgi:LasA protease